MDIKRAYGVSAPLTAGKVCQLLSTGLVTDLPVTTGKILGLVLSTDGTVLLKGTSKIHSNLVVGSKYYFDSNGNLTTDNSLINPTTFIGVALSLTDLFIPDYILS